MADVMVSYARPDLPRAEVLARRLVVDGFDVWFDRDIPPGQDFDRVIDAALQSSRAVVVLWSRNSVGSRWVVSEAAEAAAKGKLVPARLDDAVVPLEFRRVQTADLIDWNGQPDHAGYRSLVASLRSGPASVVMTTGDVMPRARPAAAPVARRRSHPVMRLLVVAALVIAGLVYWNNRGDGNGDGTGPTPDSRTDVSDTPGALSELESMRASDAPTVESVVDQWVPQVSAKRPGTEDDGIVYQLEDIVALHERLATQYGAVLLFSADYNYQSDDLWVSIVPQGSPSPDGALQFCFNQGIGRDDCFAKLITHDLSISDTVELQP